MEIFISTETKVSVHCDFTAILTHYKRYTHGVLNPQFSVNILIAFFIGYYLLCIESHLNLRLRPFKKKNILLNYCVFYYLYLFIILLFIIYFTVNFIIDVL